MSMDLYLWKLPVVTDPDEALRLLELNDETVFEASTELERFYAELMERFPPPESFADVELADAATPWADSPHGTDRLVWLSIRWSADGGHLDEIVELARAHDLVLYDPQGPSFHSPADEQEYTDEDYVPGAGEYLRGVLVFAFGIALVFLAWKASITVLSWLLIFVGGFVALVAGIGVVVTVRQGLRARSSAR